jgi:hypothetical protein
MFAGSVLGLSLIGVSEKAGFGNEAFGFGFCDSCGRLVGWNRKAAVICFSCR